MIDNNITRWIVGILIVLSLITSFYSSYQFSSAISDFSKSTQELSEQIGGGNYQEQEARIEEFLTDDGYEVLSVFIMNYTTSSPIFEQYGIKDDTICEPNETYCYTNRVGVFVDMKSLGTRNAQIWDALTTMGVTYPNAWIYWITIKSPTDTCKYMIIGNTYRDYTSVDILNNYSEETLAVAREKMAKVQENIDTLVECS